MSTNNQGNRCGTKHLSEAERARVRTLIFDGNMTASEIERVTGYSKGQIKRARDQASIGRRSGRPRKPVSPAAAEEALARKAARPPRAPKKQASSSTPQPAPQPLADPNPYAPIDNSKTIVLVTGANRGIGFSLVSSLLKSQPAPPGSSSGGPYHVFLCSRDIYKGQQAAASLSTEHGNSFSVLQVDVTSDESIKAAAQTVYFQAGRVDILVNNAGIMKYDGDPVTVLRDSLESNLISAFAMSENFKLLLMAQLQNGPRKDKRLIHVTSDLASITHRSDPTSPAYQVQAAEYRMSKAALNMMAACQAHATLGTGVRVAVWNPGFTATELAGQNPELKKAHGAKSAEEVGEAFAKVIAGERDSEFGKFLDTKDGVLPW